MKCNACGSGDIVYDPNPHGLPVIGYCSLGAPMTGEPGACLMGCLTAPAYWARRDEQCLDCGEVIAGAHGCDGPPGGFGDDP